MDYDNFRQMVLGANLFPLKSGSTANILNQNSHLKRINFNATEAYNKIVARGDNNVGFNEEVVRNTLKLNDTDKFEAPRTPQELERYLTKKCQDSMQRYIYLRVISFEHFCNIFNNCELDTDLLMILVNTFNEQVTSNAAFNN